MVRDETERERRRPRLIWLVFRHSGIGRVLAAFLVLFFLLSLVVWLAEPGIATYGDAMWFLWAVSTTVGLGDVTAATPVGRLAVVACSIAALIVVSIFTATVVDYYNERRDSLVDESVTQFLDKLEHLEDLRREELEEISERVRELRKGRTRRD